MKINVKNTYFNDKSSKIKKIKKPYIISYFLLVEKK